MFTEEELKKSRMMEDQWKKQVQAMGGGETPPINFSTSSGIKLKPVYGPKDCAGTGADNLSFPGQYPFTRGNYPLHYQIMPMAMTQGYGLENAEETRKRREWLASLGSRFTGQTGEELTVYVLAIDLPSQRGIDPDEPGARGKVGECGISISTIHDFEPLYEGLPLEKVFTTLIGLDSTLVLTALYAAYALDIRKEPLENIFMASCNYYYHQWAWDTVAFPPKAAMRIQAEFIKWILENFPLSYHTQMEGYNVAEAGATPVQEVAFNLAAIIAIMEECLKVGLDPDDIAPKFHAHPHISMNFFEEIAKLRATRKLWAKIMKEKFGCKKPESFLYKPFVAQTAGVELTAQEPLNNVIRITIMAMAGMLADVEGMWISSYDEALGIPTEEAVKVCVRTYQILQEETDIPYVTDPLGGSYFVESLTKKMEEEVEKLLSRIEELGGFLKCWESGWMRREVEAEAAKRFHRLQTGEKVKVGVNKYQTEQVSEVQAYRSPPEVEERAIQRVQEHRARRDNTRVEASLKEVRKAAIRMDQKWPESCGVLMPALVEAARAGATLGEMHGILREIFGYGYFSG